MHVFLCQNAHCLSGEGLSDFVAKRYPTVMEVCMNVAQERGAALIARIFLSEGR